MLSCLMLLATSGLLLSGGCRDTLDPFDRLHGGVPTQLVTVTDTLYPAADAFIRQTLPNRNWGTDTALQVGGGGKNRVLIRFDSTALRQAVGTGTLDSAWLEFTIQAGPTGWGSNERTVDLHRLTRTWTELGATWNCAVDANTANAVADCPTQGWDMTNNGNGTFHPVRTDRLTINNGQTGVIRLNVTADVQGYLGGTLPSQGWVFRKTQESQGGEAMVFSRESGSQPRLVVRVSTDAVPDRAPDTLPTWVYADSNISLGSTAISGPFVKRVILVRFKSAATRAERQAAVDAVGGVVVGGIPFPLDGGYYVIRVPDPGDGSNLVSAAAQIGMLPYVTIARIEIFIAPDYLRPSDGPGWTTWQLSPQLSNGQNWAAEQTAAPLAWGCETGDTAARVAVVDVGFQNLQELMRNAQLFRGTFAPFSGASHGTNVASVIAARGNDDSLMTGLMWQAKLRLYDYGPGASWASGTLGPLSASIAQVVQAALDGASIINLSAGLKGWASRPSLANANDVARVTAAAKELAVSLAALRQNGIEPLLVLSAGNDSLDAYWNGFPAAKDPTNQHQLLVVGGTTMQLTVWDSSNYGALVDVLAPGGQVYVLDGDEVVRPKSGTSLAAPHVTGIAGLLLSMDTTLDATALRRLIDDGASEGGIGIGGKYLVNAYESLKLAAERPGAPLCANRLWTEGSQVKAQRGTVTETLADVGTPLLNVTAMHGGRRLLYTTGSGVGALQYQNGAWVSGPQLPGDTLFNGVTSAVSHDGDSIAYVSGWGGGPLTVEIGAIGAAPAYTHTVPMPARTSNLICEMDFNGSCQQWFDAGLEFSPYPSDDDPGYAVSIQYSTAGDEVYLSVPTWVQHIASPGQPTACPFFPAALCYPISLGWQVTGATVYAINIRTGARRTVDTSTGAGIWQVGISESNQQMTSVRGAYQYAYVRRWWLGTSGGPFGSFSSCFSEFTPINGATTPAAQSFPLPAGSVCTGTPYRGTFAPIRAASRR